MNQDWDELKTVIKSFASGRSKGGFPARFDTSDVSQETLIQLLQFSSDKNRAAKTTDAPLKVNKRWLRRAARGTSSKLRRFHSAKKRDVNAEVLAADVTHRVDKTPEQMAIENEMKIRLALALQKLSAQERTIVDHRHAKSMTFVAIAEKLQCPLYQVKRIYQTALKTLKIELT